ncbi:MAG: chloride channel protein [Bacteroidetes bacterium]|nr:chloride channel protein [Bacteroidota bacterium]MBS1975302.1 chloride channel protein [Bacteroidota bacterium]
MRQSDESIPLSTSLKTFYDKEVSARKYPVDKRVLYLSIQAFINALIIGAIAKLLVLLISLVTNISFYQKFSLENTSPSGNHLGWLVILVPVLGSIIVGAMAKYGSKSIRGHGIPEAMEIIISGESKIPPVITFLKPLSSAISIGTGGPFGAEGPIIATGAAFGSLTGQVMHISNSERKIILAAGACAGMSAIFGSPLAAVLLAIELLLFEFSPRSIIPVSLACITGAGMHILLFGKDPVFAMAAIPVAKNSILFIYVALGLVIGALAALVSKSVYAVEDLFERLPIHWMWWPAIGAVAVGIVGYFAPHTMGVGYDNIRNLLTGSLPLSILFSLCLLKYISWVIALGSGTSGGTLAPLFTIGGALGALLGTMSLHFFPTLGINVATAALIGMAAMFAGASRALLTSIVFALETTGQINGLLPLMCACAAAYFVSFFLLRNGSIMTEKIQRRGIKAPDSFEPDTLKTISVAELVSPLEPEHKNLPSIYMDDDVGLAAEMMGKYDKETLLVLENKENLKAVGTITASSILKYYSDQKQKEHLYDSPTATKRLIVRGRKLMKKVRK